MIVPVVRQPNIGNGFDDQNNITLTLFNTILENTSTRVELERPWEVIERDINIREHWEARKDNPEINNNVSSYLFNILFHVL
jgi:hypothetical protein